MESLRVNLEAIDELIYRYHSYNRPFDHNLPDNCYQINPQSFFTFNNNQNIKMTVIFNSKFKKIKVSGVQAVKNHEQEIRDALSMGCSLKMIYEMIKDPESMPIAYSTFQKYTKKYIIDMPEPKNYDYHSKYHALAMA